MAPITLQAGIRSAAAALTLGLVLLTGTGCSYDNPAETAKITPATNGINTVVGAVKLADMLVLSYGADQPGRIIGTVFNTSPTDAIVTISGASGSRIDSGEGQRPNVPGPTTGHDVGSDGGIPRFHGHGPGERKRDRDVGRRPTPGPRLHPARISVLHARGTRIRHPINRTDRGHCFAGRTCDQPIGSGAGTLIPDPAVGMRAQTPGVPVDPACALTVLPVQHRRPFSAAIRSARRNETGRLFLVALVAAHLVLCRRRLSGRDSAAGLQAGDVALERIGVGRRRRFTRRFGACFGFFVVRPGCARSRSGLAGSFSGW